MLFELCPKRVKEIQPFEVLGNYSSPISAKKQIITTVIFCIFTWSKDCQLFNMRNWESYIGTNLLNSLMSRPGASS